MASAKHVEIRETIEADIHRGLFEVGQKLPTEKELMERFGVSRNPVQKAMSALVEAGLVSRKRGSGTVVASAGLRTNLLRMMDPAITSPEVTGDHKVVHVEVSSAESFSLSQSVFPRGQPTASLTRVKFSSEGLPLAFERCLINLTLAPEVLSQNLEQLTTIAYYNSLGLGIRRANTVLKAVNPGAVEAGNLDISTSDPVICQQRTTHLADESVIEIAEFFIHPRNMTLEVSQIDNS